VDQLLIRKRVLNVISRAFEIRPTALRAGVILTSAAALVLAGCSSGRGGPVAYNPPNFGAPDVQATALSPTEQRIGPLDKLKISVFNVEAMSGEYQVNSAGNISYSLLGTIPAAGKTAEELAVMLASRLNEKLYRNPKVQVAISAPAELNVTVDGSVKSPGTFPIKGTTSLMRVVALASGMAEDANPSRVIVFRTVNGQKVAGAYDLQAIRRAQEPDPTIYGNDIVIVDGSRARRLFKEILSTVPILGVLRPF
jgi:polysaccharide export outer membrane protein